MRWLACVLGVLALIPLGALSVLALVTPVTFFAWLYLLGLGLIVAGLLSTPWRRTKYRGLTRIGLMFIALTAGARLVLVGRNVAVQLITLPGQGGVRWIDSLLDEQDVTLLAGRLLSSAGLITPAEGADLISALHAGYQSMHSAAGWLPSPFAATYLNLQSSRTFDVLVIGPDTSQRPPQIGLIFLHGFAGNFSLPCWWVAQAAQRVAAVTVCPSVGWQGDWWTSDGLATLQATLDYLHARGIQRVYLAGLSNGGIGASELTPRLIDQLSGLILISGASPNGSTGGLPLLVIHGRDDTRISASVSRQFADRAGDRATYVELPGDHFVLAKRAAEVIEAIATWLIRQEGATES